MLALPLAAFALWRAGLVRWWAPAPVVAGFVGFMVSNVTWWGCAITTAVLRGLLRRAGPGDPGAYGGVMSTSSDTDHLSPTELLLQYLQREREHLVGTLDGLSEYDVRRPMTPTGTSLLGLVKHVLSVELGYLAECVGRTPRIELPWDEEQSFTRQRRHVGAGGRPP